MKRLIGLLTIMATLVLGGAAWAKDPIKIGILGPFSGSLAFNAGEMKKGMELAVDEVNAKGGLFGSKVELIYGDTEAKPDKGVAAVKKLISRDNVLVVGGCYASSVGIATSQVCQEEMVPFVVAIAISPTITSRGFDYVFRTSPDSPMFLNGINEWMEKVKKPKTVAFLMENSDYGRDGERIWSAVAKKIGAQDQAHLYFEIGDTDFTSPISKLKELKPDVTFSIASTTEAALIQKQAKELGFVTQWVGVGGHFTQAFFELTGPVSQYAMGSSLEPTLNVKDPEAQDFVKRFMAKYADSRPGIFSSQGYDNVMVILDAIKRAGEPSGKLQKDRDAVKNALAKTDLKVTQGRIVFDKNGQVNTVKPTVVQVQLVDGKPQLAIVYPPELATTEYKTPLPWDKR